MSDAPQALMLHLESGAEPIMVAIAAEDTAGLSGQLAALLSRGSVETIHTANGNGFAVNFGKVIAAHIGAMPPMARIYGRPGHDAD